jgi:hypothetical protein
MSNKKYIAVKKAYGFPYKHHKNWNVLVETKDNEIISINKTVKVKLNL